MFPPKRTKRPSPLQNWHTPVPAPQKPDFILLATDLLFLSLRKGAWNGLRIGAVYGGLLGFALGASPHTFLGPLIMSVICLIAGTIIGGLIGLCAGLFFGLLWAVSTTIVSRLCFYPLHHWSPHQLCNAVINMLLVLVSFSVWATSSSMGQQSFDIAPYEFSSLGYIIPALGFSYGPLLVICIYSWFHTKLLAHTYATEVGIVPKTPLISPTTDLYDQQFQQHLFSALSERYASTTRLISLGQSDRLRARLVERMHLLPGMAVCDLMTGGGELWPHLLPLIGPGGSITAVDFTPEMLAHAQKRLDRLPAHSAVTLHQADVRATGLPAESFDAVVCAFGINTMSLAQWNELLEEVHRILRPGGIFGFVELSRPVGDQRRRWMNTYLTQVVPPLSELLGADRSAYELMHKYVARFDGGYLLQQSFHRHRCVFYHYELLDGCAVAIVGMKEMA